MCIRCDIESYTTFQKLGIIGRVVTRYGFYNVLGSNPLAGHFHHHFLFHERDLLYDGFEPEEKGIALYYLDPPLWRRRTMIRSHDGHFYYESTEEHLDCVRDVITAVNRVWFLL